MSKTVLYERLQQMGQGLERIRRYEERTSGIPLHPSSLLAPSFSSKSELSSARSSEDYARVQKKSRKRKHLLEGDSVSPSGPSPRNESGAVPDVSTRIDTRYGSHSSSSSTSSASVSSPRAGSKRITKGKVHCGHFSHKNSGGGNSSSSSSRGCREDISSQDGVKKKRPRQTPVNKVDPIMRVPLRRNGVWKFSRPNGGVVAFNSDTLADFMLASGDFHDPETRIPFTEEQLHEIDSICAKSQKNGAKQRRSLVDAMRNPQVYVEARERRDALEGLERCAGELIADILEVIETVDPDDAQIRLVTHELPVFADLFRQLYEADSTYAYQCLEHWRAFIAGPPNRPNEDEFGLVDCVKHYLHMLHDNPSPSVAAVAGTGDGVLPQASIQL